VTTTHPGSVRRIPEPNYPNFPAEEIAARCRRMREVMAEEGLDLLLLTERENVVYFSGLSSCAWVQKGVVPAVVLLHVDTDEPVMLLPDFWLGTAEKTTWYRDFVLHHASHSDPHDFVNLLVSTIKERGWGGGRIGYEAGHEMLMGLPIADWEHLRAQLDAPFVPAGEPIWKVRMIKSPLEIDLMRRAWLIASASAREGWGMTLTEAAACGTPAVATRIAGHADAVQEGSSGILTDADPAALGEGLAQVLADRALRDELTAGATAWAAQLTWSATATQLMRVVADEVTRRRSPR